MMEREWLFTRESVRHAEMWIQSAIEEGSSAAKALREYRSAGQSIRTEWWYGAWREHAQAQPRAASYERMPAETTISESFWTYTAKRYESEFAQVSRISYVNPESMGSSKLHLTVESDRPLTLREWMEMRNEILSRYPWLHDMMDVDIETLGYYKRV